MQYQNISDIQAMKVIISNIYDRFKCLNGLNEKRRYLCDNKADYDPTAWQCQINIIDSFRQLYSSIYNSLIYTMENHRNRAIQSEFVNLRKLGSTQLINFDRQLHEF